MNNLFSRPAAVFMSILCIFLATGCTGPGTKPTQFENLIQETAGNARLKLAIRSRFAENMDADSRNYANVFLDFFESALTNEKAFTIYERKDISVLAGEHIDQASGILSKVVQSQYLANGVSRLMYATIKRIGGDLSIQIKLTDMETGEILTSQMETTLVDSSRLKATAAKMAKSFSAPFKN